MGVSSTYRHANSLQQEVLEDSSDSSPSGVVQGLMPQRPSRPCFRLQVGATNSVLLESSALAQGDSPWQCTDLRLYDQALSTPRRCLSARDTVGQTLAFAIPPLLPRAKLCG